MTLPHVIIKEDPLLLIMILCLVSWYLGACIVIVIDHIVKYYQFVIWIIGHLFKNTTEKMEGCKISHIPRRYIGAVCSFSLLV
jgi:hypothetical protein